MTDQGLKAWQHLRSRLRRQWWVYVAVALVGTIWFVRDLPPRDPLVFAVLLLIPVLSLRQAWKVDRQIVACDAHLAHLVPVNGESHE